jgi:hypothetical protein
MVQKAKGGKKQRKFGRNARSCQRYSLENRRVKNKIKRLLKRIASHPKDKTAVTALARYR